MKTMPDTHSGALGQVLCFLDELAASGGRVICAIDGPSASGKTTLASALSEKRVCTVLSMDDFFLRPGQRTKERLSEPGGNVDRERFRAEVLEPLLAGDPFSYKPYDCKTQSLSEAVRVNPGRLCVVEGVYSLHPSLSTAYDLRVFLDIDPVEQRRRLLKRNPSLYPRFEREWLPMELAYFRTFDIKTRCDIVIKAG